MRHTRPSGGRPKVARCSDSSWQNQVSGAGETSRNDTIANAFCTVETGGRDKAALGLTRERGEVGVRQYVSGRSSWTGGWRVEDTPVWEPIQSRFSCHLLCVGPTCCVWRPTSLAGALESTLKSASIRCMASGKQGPVVKSVAISAGPALECGGLTTRNSANAIQVFHVRARC